MFKTSFIKQPAQTEQNIIRPVSGEEKELIDVALWGDMSESEWGSEVFQRVYWWGQGRIWVTVYVKGRFVQLVFVEMCW